MKIEKSTVNKLAFRWAIYGISVASLLFVMAGVYLIVRICDGNWADWKLPTILGIIWLVLVIISAMFVAIPEIKNGIKFGIDKIEIKE